jgi:asparagine synthase (glutamine-hydrolysing)
MRDSLRHRGPDGEGGAEVSGGADGAQLRGWFGHRRLKILDLSGAAHQPMANDTGSVLLTYNGEVYNFRELRRELEVLGHRFDSTGDTEVVLRAYEAWGEGCIERLDGMFALALWDARRATLLLARDRTGKKPLFYCCADERLTFGSEIKALTACPWVARELDRARLPEFLTYGYVPHPYTLFRGIKQVPPGTFLTFGPRGVSEPHSYWDGLPNDGPVPWGTGTRRHIVELLQDAVRRRMISDVPLGALLSGGIDSSIVVGLMTKASAEPVHTFSIGFPEEPSFDERGAAHLVARHFRTRHTDFAVRLDAVSLMDRLLWHHDQPYADSSAVPTFIVSRLAREHVKVVLNGDGGDEVFGGYDRFRAAALSRPMPPLFARTARRAAGILPRRHGYFSLQRRATRFLELADRPVREQYQSWIAVANTDLLQEMLSPELRTIVEEHPPDAAMSTQYQRVSRLPELDQILYANLRTYLPDDLAVKMDRMSMANSLEARSPFLDTALIDFMARLPAKRKVGLRRLKPVLRESFYPLLPREVWDRPKHGFGVPMGTWFRGELGTMFEDEVLAKDSRTTDLLAPETLARLWREHRAGEAEHGSRLWTVLMLERWLRSLERAQEAAPPGGDGIAEPLTVR